MLDLSRRLALAPNPELALEALAESIRRPVAARRCDILEKVGGAWRIAVSTSRSPEMTREDAGFAEHAVSTGQLIRSLPEGQRRHPFRRAAQAAASVSYIPFRTPEGGAGAIRLEGELRAPGAGDLEALLRAFADETGVAVHRAGLARQARAAEDIRRSDELKSALLASVSHDLRSPLTAIKAAVGSLRTPGLAWTEEDREQLLSLIESQTDRLTATVTDLLDMSRIEGGAVQPDIEPVQVAPLLEEAAVPARTAGRPVEIDAPADLWLRADYGLLLQALRNLVENAVKYASGAIRLRGREDGRLAFLEVSDEGPGIDPADLPHVFERFYRGTRTREKPQGTGLGLSIVRAMVELCGGRVSVASSPAGTTFQVTLPAVEPPR
jgi:two-component system sensor histidine kinase KdpD